MVARQRQERRSDKRRIAVITYKREKQHAHMARHGLSAFACTGKNRQEAYT